MRKSGHRMLQLLFDEDVDFRLTRGLRNALPDLDAPTIQELGLSGLPDATVLAYAAKHGHCVITHDVQTMTAALWARIASGEPTNGMFVVSRDMPIGTAIEQLAFAIEVVTFDELADDPLRYVPLW